VTRPTLAATRAVAADLGIGLVVGVDTAVAAVAISPDATRSPWTWVAVPLAAWVAGNRVAWLLVGRGRRRWAGSG
jgi:hypothetical protein